MTFAFYDLETTGTLGECHELCVSGLAHAGFRYGLRVEAHVEYDSELIAGCKPFPDIPAAFREVADRQIDQLGRGFLGRERAAGFDRFADHPNSRTPGAL